MKVAILETYFTAFGQPQASAELIAASASPYTGKLIPVLLKLGTRAELEIEAAANGHEVVSADALFEDE